MATPLLRLAIMRPPSSGPNRTALARVKINAPAAAPASRSRSGKSVSASCASARRRGGPARPLIGNEWWLPPRSLRLALRVARPPPAVLSGRRFGSVGCGARRLRGPQRLRALPSPPRHFKWGRGCGAARLRLRSAAPQGDSAACGRRGCQVFIDKASYRHLPVCEN